MSAQILHCRSQQNFVSLGPVPPRMPGRPDAQVPGDLADGPTRYARFAQVYFYDIDSPADPTFGFVDLEISLQQIGGQAVVEIYCAGDGYQSGTGMADGAPLRLEFAAGDVTLTTCDWPYPDVVSGRSDPLTFRTTLDLAPADFDRADRIVIPPATALCRVELA